jgi:hypothetical protein
VYPDDIGVQISITRIGQVMCGALEISEDILDSQLLMGPMALGYGTSVPTSLLHHPAV